LKNAIIILVLFLTVGMANADEEVKSFSGSGEAGLLMTSGNSETDSVNAKMGLKYEKDHLLGEVNLAALYSSETTEVDGKKEDKVSAEKYNYSAKIGYKFNPANYIFVNGDYEDDRFSGYDYKTTYSIGYGRKLIDSDTVKLNIEIGPGYRYDKTNGYWDDKGDNDDSNDEFIDEKTEDEAVFRGYAMFNYKFSEAISFQQDLTIITGSSNTNTKSASALKTQIIGALAMKVAYKIDNNTDVPADKEKTDTETALTLVYDF
jgi:putative salt-induced outer membrane protein YdiY